jgi:hypothetical protein
VVIPVDLSLLECMCFPTPSSIQCIALFVTDFAEIIYIVKKLALFLKCECISLLELPNRIIQTEGLKQQKLVLFRRSEL